MKISVLPFFLLLSLGLWSFGTGREGAPIKKTSLALPDDSQNSEFIRIALTKSVPELSLATDSPFILRDSTGRALMRGERIASAKIIPTANGMQFGNQKFIENPLVLESQGSGIKMGGKTYRHVIEVWRENEKKISAINEISIEDYLRGVLPWEANPAWTPEALKAQAIVSRTYALFKMLENKSQRFHLTQDVLSQVYGGRTLEHRTTDAAIDATRGLVLTYNGEIFPAYFHSTCGGATTRAEYLWDVEPHPSLQGVICPYCKASKHYYWTGSFSSWDILKRLQAHGVKIKNLRQIRIGDKDETGRAKNFIVDYDGGSVKLHSNDFRLWMDPAKFKSTLIVSFEKKGNQYIIQGRGWGHGVGLCQYGVKHLGEQGVKAEKILDFYFPSAKVTSLKVVSGIPSVPVTPNVSSDGSGFWQSVSEKFQELTGQ